MPSFLISFAVIRLQVLTAVFTQATRNRFCAGNFVRIIEGKFLTTHSVRYQVEVKQKLKKFLYLSSL